MVVVIEIAFSNESLEYQMEIATIANKRQDMIRYFFIKVKEIKLDKRKAKIEYSEIISK
jgi:hypothetical protein